MAKKKPNSLLDQLGASLDKKNATPAKAPKKQPAQGTGAGKIDKKPKAETPKAKNKNFSLYPGDYAAIKDIQNIIYDSTGTLPNASLAVRIALRSCTRERAALLKIFEDIRKEDSRMKA